MLAAVWEHTVRVGVEDPGVFPVAADLAEALTEARRRFIVSRFPRFAAARPRLRWAEGLSR
jgi:hypothetical protein